MTIMQTQNIPSEISTDVNIKKTDLNKLLLLSIALEEISLSHILNAQGEIIQAYLKHHKCPTHIKIEELIKVNRNVAETLRILLEKEKTLKDKLLYVIQFDEESDEDDHYCYRC